MAGAGRRDAGLWSLADLVTPMALRVAATLRVADHIADGVCTAAALAVTVGADAAVLDRVLRHLVTVDVLTCDVTGRYGLTARGATLRDDDPSGMRGLLDLDGAIGRADLSFVHLMHCVRTGEAAFPVLYGRSFWDDLATDPVRTTSFDAQMGSDVAAWAPLVLASYDWGPLGHVVDVGGGNGTLLAAMLHAHPGLHGTVFDRPDTAVAAARTLTAAGLAGRADVVSGSFFDPLPAGADGYVLCAVLHNWNDDAARVILRRCAEAAGRAGIVFVVEKTGAGGEPRTEMDLRVLVYFGARERGVAELTALVDGTGLEVAHVHVAGDLSILELTASG